MQTYLPSTETINTQLKSALTVRCKCVPQNPFYVRWLNRFGGIDYWMFSYSQKYGRTLDKQEDFVPYISNTETARGTHYSLSKEVVEKIVIGAENLNQNQWYELSRIPWSPMVQWYNKERNLWFDILPQKGDCELDTNQNTHTIELEFLLPQPQLQQ